VYIDRFCAAKGDSFKPRAYAVGQTPQKSAHKSSAEHDKSKGPSNTPKAGDSPPKTATNAPATPQK